MIKRWMMVLGALAAGVVLFLLFRPGGGRSAGESSAPIPAPDFQVPDLSGKPRSLSGFKGQVVLLDFWATWCTSCEEELPDLKRLYANFKDRGFTIVGVSMDEAGPAVVASYVREKAIPYPVLLAGPQPPQGYDIPGFPTAFLIDRAGNIRAQYLGANAYEDMAPDVEKLLAQ